MRQKANEVVQTESQFYEYVEGLVSSSQSIDYYWSDDQLTISFRKTNQDGFDIQVTYDPKSKIMELQTDRGYHDHFHTDRFEDFEAALGCVFGFVRDLLSCNMRIKETCVNGKPRKWQLQAKSNDRWINESSTGLLFSNFLGKSTTHEYSNRTLPPRGGWNDA